MKKQLFKLNKINILSSFNPSNFIINIHSSWIILLLLFMLTKKNKIEKLYLFLKIEISKNLFQSIRIKKRLIKINNIKTFRIVLIVIFFVNIYRLTFFSFSLSRQINFNFNIILFIWILTFLLEIKFFKNFITHLCPKRCPLILSNFIIIIELVRFFIRLIVLILRLTINIFSGHMIIIIISIGIIISYKTFFIIIPIFLFMILKIIVRLIQRYILSILLTIYLNQRNLFTL